MVGALLPLGQAEEAGAEVQEQQKRHLKRSLTLTWGQAELLGQRQGAQKQEVREARAVHSVQARPEQQVEVEKLVSMKWNTLNTYLITDSGLLVLPMAHPL